MSGVPFAVIVTIGYLLGSIPVAGLVARRHGAVDLRRTGDRNPGYWNARETLGARAALPVFIGDAAKGAAAAGIALSLSSDWRLGYVGAGAAMIGHAWPLFAGFRGGRSVLTFAGAICVLAPLAAAIAIALLLLVMATTRSFAWAARVGVFSLPFVQLATDGPYRTAATGCLMTLIGVRFAMAAFSDRRNAPPQPAG
jgi:glycerol-3-phosphate acyltransferase PlsY